MPRKVWIIVTNRRFRYIFYCIISDIIIKSVQFEQFGIVDFETTGTKLFCGLINDIHLNTYKPSIFKFEKKIVQTKSFIKLSKKKGYSNKLC